MNLCYIFAMEAEAMPIIQSSEILEQRHLGFAKLYKLSYGGRVFYALISGVGKVLASSSVTAACVKYPEIDAYVNLGIGGSMNPERAPLLSAAISTDFYQHDLDTTGVGDPIAWLSGLNVDHIASDVTLAHKLNDACERLGVKSAFGVMASGDQFVTDEQRKRWIVDTFRALCVDMEAAAYAEICKVYGKPFASLRVISDAVDHEAEYRLYKNKAIEVMSTIGLALLPLCA